jgi:glycogen synthase
MKYQPGEFDHIFNTKIDSWVMITSKFHELFSQKEIDALKRAERAFITKRRTIVFLSFENPYASLGGLAAVAHHLPLWLSKRKEKVLFVTPFHSENSQMQKALQTGQLKERFKNKVFHLSNFEGVLSCYQAVSSEYPAFYLEINDRFCAGDNPYGYSDSNDLLLDSLAFSAAVPFALKLLGYTENLIFHAHDWETAPIAITSKLAVVSSLLAQARTVLTLHNSFDTGLPQKYKTLFWGKPIQGDTILQCTLPFLNGPLTTVSTPFAHELRHDPLQRGIFTDHLQQVFSMNPPIGIENGMFGEPSPPFTEESIVAANGGDITTISEQKEKYRLEFIKEVQTLKDDRIIGSIKMPVRSGKIPMFFMSGRLDFMQKGFDVIFHAFEKLPRGKAKLFFCPSSKNSDDSMDFFTDIALRCKGDIIIVPYRISREQYNTFLQGSSFLLMPSFYEPFGAATEGLMHGTPVLARGTGGLWVQVNPSDGLYVPSLYGNILNLDKRMEFPTGILYREDYPDSAAEKNWRELLNLSVEKRIANPLYTAMVDSAYNALSIAINMFGDSKKYTSMILNGLGSVHQFSWDRAVYKYQKIYETICYRGL